MAKLTVDAERLTPGGRLNAYGLALVFVLVLGDGAADVFQSLVRIWNNKYSTGLPDPLSLLIVFGVLFLISVFIVVRLDPPGPRGTK